MRGQRLIGLDVENKACAALLPSPTLLLRVVRDGLNLPDTGKRQIRRCIAHATNGGFADRQESAATGRAYFSRTLVMTPK